MTGVEFVNVNEVTEGNPSFILFVLISAENVPVIVTTSDIFAARE